MKEKEPFEKK